ncbi:hypothetical protein CROQUDRAFT_667279 [Cronartium quercuum f. sp. fusiforme G11]|uniref:Secreted protein n=1 Tax=Cronartium quercuum f. sp. fusiforme G11 TaxID=708437 RepID=A0A9P6NUX4_9BASI|nr:hypothetical protein CROQUDRAFT_667279 [Cronartium quercuum f. sp. fusiforme G11]
MRCSIAFIAAAIAVTVLASHESNYKVMARNSAPNRLDRRSPEEKTVKMKDETDMKCFGGGPGCGGQMSFVANQGFQQVSTIVTVQNIQQVGTFPAIPSIPPIAQQGWAGCGQGFSFFASSLSAFALAFQQTQIAQAQLVQSFFNISRLFSLIIQQIQGFAQWGSVDPFMSQIGPIYGHIFQLIQGLLAAINSVCGLPTFIALVGPQWQAFGQNLMFLATFGGQCGLMQSNFLSNVNFGFFQQCGVPGFNQGFIQQMGSQFSITQTQSVSFSAFSQFNGGPVDVPGFSPTSGDFSSPSSPFGGLSNDQNSLGRASGVQSQTASPLSDSSENSVDPSTQTATDTQQSSNGPLSTSNAESTPQQESSPLTSLLSTLSL